ncbi:S-adenosyl-L-methionine-dependent methyltransferase [Aspergillus sclerotioniger CBS 115572]|uniref:S-adenosyl-L-methionine-dependent methyltransferase n=1 Tax=Aspergillus sclerotioniger CBS 115572 TaxID=1450535 RepID=A0A317WFH0_9EURO|nr:S-adenosyl-L-methionine-dependent methyltransferase [Aspergillus sclerotioniger CBS 115572]PWY84685.1 S-adenosyl-L-methionine-dependent methyltransferase [Aspergillus sclerotioniger CBS 115572]
MPKLSPTTYFTPTFVKRYYIAEKLTGVFVDPLIEQSGILNPSPHPRVILDNACGLGIVSSHLNRTLEEEVKKQWTLTCGDVTEMMVEHTKLRIEKEGWVGAEARVVDAQCTGLEGGKYTNVFTAFAFMMLPDARAAMKECFRILQPGGVLATSTWKISTWIVLIKEAIDTMPGGLKFPNMKEFLGMHNEGWDDESFVKERFEEEGFQDVKVTTVVRETSLTISEFMEISQGVISIVIGAFWTPEQREQHEANALVVVREYLEEKFGADGVVRMEPVAVIAAGRKP